MRIVCVGDSITAGQYLPPGVSAWPERIGAEGRGVCGETTRQALERFPRDVQANPADVTIIQYGHNDANKWDTDGGLPRVSLSAFRANLSEMVDRCWAFDTLPVLCSITPTTKDSGYDRELNDYNVELKREAWAWGIKLVDVRKMFLEGDLDDLLLADGVHLSEQGHELYAETVSASVLVPA